MNKFISWLLIPFLTFIVSGPRDWFTSNFSVVGSVFPQNVLLLIWALVIGRLYHTFTKRTIGQTAPFLSAEKELVMTDVSVGLLIAAVFLPYRPKTQPIVSFLHLAMAFTATVIFFLAITRVNLKLYFLDPKLFSLPTALLVLAIFISASLLILCNFVITSALEIFLTLFSCFWLNLFEKRVRRFNHKSRS
ncbi:MAG: hypothetical protein IJ374_02050 [Lachnospiraceae bacterium]|nr:hypothetical protein [Lachnospiraceae bacterium]